MVSTSDAGTSRAGRLLDELAALVLPVVMPVVRRLPTVVLALATALTAVGVLVLVAATLNDAAIERNPEVATAEVLPGSDFSRTLVRFTTAAGETVVPEEGVFYPRGLRPGQIVRVEYAADDPDLVRVLGRDASVGVVPIALMTVVVWVVALPLYWRLRHGRWRWRR